MNAGSWAAIGGTVFGWVLVWSGIAIPVKLGELVGRRKARKVVDK